MTVPAPGAHGGDGAAIAAWLGVPTDAVLDLSASLSPVATDVAPLLARHAAEVHRYGDPRVLEARIAALVDVEPQQLILTNGASEAIALVARLHPRGRVDEPEFSLYRRHLVVDPTAGRWRSNPHSPSGQLARADDRAAVWDEAYWQLATGTWTRGDHVDGSIVIGSLTKVFALPGLRVGYVVAPDPATASALRVLRPEWSVGALALAVVDDLVADVDLADVSTRVAAARSALVDVLDARGLDVVAADAPWVLVHGVTGLRDHLARLGVVVRDCASFGMPTTVRIGVPDPSGLTRLAAALDTVLTDTVLTDTVLTDTVPTDTDTGRR